MSKPIHAKYAAAMALCVMSSVFATSSQARDMLGGQYKEWYYGGNVILPAIGRGAACVFTGAIFEGGCGDVAVERPKPETPLKVSPGGDLLLSGPYYSIQPNGAVYIGSNRNVQL